MIVSLEKNASSENVVKIADFLKELGWNSSFVKTPQAQYLVAIGSREFDIRRVGHLKGVKDVHRVRDAYKLVSREWKVQPTIVDLGDDVRIGAGTLSIMAGPCSIENDSQVQATLDFLVSQGMRIMRGGAFKPRSSPYSFRGLGIEGLKMFASAARSKGVKVITEVLDPSQIGAMYDYVDVFQVGTRNAQNFSLLDELGKVDKPVLIKRGMSGTLEELLQSAEYVFANGNDKLILCERGIRTFEKAYRNTLDLNAVPYLKEKSHLPVVVDPSHGVGIRRYVMPMAMAAVMAGADGILVEIHEQPEKAASDGAQTLNFDESRDLVRRLRSCFDLRSQLSKE